MKGSSQKGKPPSHPKPLGSSSSSSSSRGRPLLPHHHHAGVGWPYDASVAARNRFTIDNGGLYTDVTFEFLPQPPSPPPAAAEDRRAEVAGGDGRGRETVVAIGAHKALLAASSPVFRAMFESGMKESWTNVVTIAHAHPDVFFQMIEFIYTDNLKTTEQTILPLMELAHMYIITRLSIQCSQYLKNRLSVENVCHALATCVIHDEKKLELRCWQIIHWATENVVRTEGFLSLDRKTVQRFAEMKYSVAKESVIWNGCVRWAKHQPLKPDWTQLSAEDVVARHLGGGIINAIDFSSIPRNDFEQIVCHSEDDKGIALKVTGSSSRGRTRHHPRMRRRRRPMESYVDRFNDARTNHLRGSTKPGKTSPDSISFTCTKDVLITGVEIYTARLSTSYDADIEVHEGNHRLRKYSVTIYPAAPYNNRMVQTAKIFFEEDRLWLAKAKKVYTVTVTQEGHLPESIGVDGHARCWATGVRFEFTNSVIVPWSRSTVSGGQFARFYFHVLCDV